MNTSRGHLRFIADGRESLKEHQRDQIREGLLQKHQRELHAAGFLRRWLLRWQIECEAARHEASEQPSDKTLFIVQK